MATSYTPVLNLAKPVVNGAETENTWGFDLNANFDKLDAAHVTPEEMTQFLDDVVANMLEAGDNVTLEYKDISNTVRISATGEIVVTDPGEGQTFFVTWAAATLATLGPEIKSLRTGAFSLHGDGGGGEYVRRSTAPYQLWTVKDYVLGVSCQNAAGLYYRLTQRPAAAGGDATSTLEPVHTTFDTPITRGDGYYWLRILQEPQWIRTVDRYTREGVVDALHGGWFELQGQNGVFYIEQFGGRADYPGWFGGGAVPTTGTDNYEPLMTMTRWVKFSPSPFEFSTSGRMSAIIQLGAGRYKFGQTVMPYSTVHIRGIGTDQDPFGYGPLTQLWFVNTTGSAFCFVSNNTGPTEDSGSMPFGNNPGSAYGSILEGLSIHGTWSSATGASMSNTDNTAAVRARCMIECRNVQVNGWRSTGFHIHASIGAGTGYPMEGNANQWRLTNCYVFSCGGHGLLVAGNDANTGYSINFSTHGGGNVRGAGLIDGSALGNTHLQPHIAGYGDRGVHRAGKHYQWMLSGNPQVLVPGAPGSENCWYHVSDGPMHPVIWPEWVAGTPEDSLLKLPFYVFSTATVLVGPYIEINNTIGFSQSKVILGGTPELTETSAIYKGGSGTFVSFVKKPSSAEYLANGPNTYALFGGADGAGGFGPNGGINLISFMREKDGGTPWNWGFQGKDIHFAGPAGKIWDITTPSSDATFGGNAPRPGRLVLYNLVLANASPNYGQRAVSLRDGIPSAQSGEYVAGEWYFQSNPLSQGTAAYSCTVSGVIADRAWAPAPGGEGGNTVVSTSSGRFYRSGLYGVWSIEPTHTSGTQTYPPDTVAWTYMGNSVPTFEKCAIFDPPADDVRYVRQNGDWVAADTPDLTPLEAKIAELQARIEALEV